MLLTSVAIVSFLALGCQSIYQDVTLYSGQECQGSSAYVSDDTPDLSVLGFNDMAQSRQQNGLWIYYENGDYNMNGGYTLITWAIRYCSTFDPEERNMMSSMRFAGKRDSLNAETFSLYDGFFFSRNEYWGATDVAMLEGFNDAATSIIITGQSSWTIYSDGNYQGLSLCIVPDSWIQAGSDRIDLGYVGNLADYGLDKQISSIRKGCFSNNVMKVSLPALTESSDVGMVAMEV